MGESSIGKNQNNEKVNPLNDEETRLDIKCSHNTMRKYYDKHHQKPRKYKEVAVQKKLQKLTIEEISLIYHRSLAECSPASLKNNRSEIFLNLSISELEIVTIAALLYPLLKKK
ncbi:hypothetical protein HZH68_016134 [Vespula germanica]|uniref:Uncharacterized protein n=1 Tax=Vespula germanica TaxID=30212 RepID=A0A834MRR2_VESGE|nr:hypothetical protein HZH68_016134 [Vespula germanica]